MAASVAAATRGAGRRSAPAPTCRAQTSARRALRSVASAPWRGRWRCAGAGRRRTRGGSGGGCRDREIGRASCRERVCQYVEISVVAVSLKKKLNKKELNENKRYM